MAGHAGAQRPSKQAHDEQYHPNVQALQARQEYRVVLRAARHIDIAKAWTHLSLVPDIVLLHDALKLKPIT